MGKEAPENGSRVKRDAWQEYYAATNSRPPRETTMKALELFEGEDRSVPAIKGARRSPRQAVDLGCGAGNDALEILRRGWRILAVDEQEEAIGHLLAVASGPTGALLETRIARFTEIELPGADLVNASFSLPFARPGEFGTLWERIVGALSPGGRFAGHFFGDRDDWASDPELTVHTAAQVRTLFDRFKIEYFLERDEDGITALGEPKHWHTFSVVALRNADRRGGSP